MLLKLRILSSIINVIYLILYWIILFYKKLYKKSPSIPAPKKSLFTLSATTLAKKIRQREITSYHLVDDYIEWIKELNPYVNAVVGNRFGDAIVEAKICDEQLRSGKFDIETLEKEKPLYGVPFTIKECCSVKGCSYTCGILARKGIKANRDGKVVELLRNAGAIPICVTNSAEMCGGPDTSNLLFGRTRNAYNSIYSAGGSSGGEGALLGAGASLIGFGSDFAGSIRFPAFCNGVFGLKPTPGIVSCEGHIPWSEDETFQKHLSLGPLTRYAEDLELLMKVVTAKCDRPLHLNVPVNLKQLKVYYRQSIDNTLGMLPVEPEIKECILKAAKHFIQYGNSVEKVPIEWPTELIEITFALYFSIKKTSFLEDINNSLQKNPIGQLVKAFLGLSQHTLQTTLFATSFNTRLSFSESDIQYYTKQGEEIREKLLNLLGQNGVLIYPTYPITGTLSELSLCEFLCHVYCGMFNAFGFPAVNVPMGLNRNGLPLGIQVIAAPYQDRLCLAVAKELETAFGGWIPPYSVSN